MKVFISADIEGVSGVVDSEFQTTVTGRDYEKARRLMTLDVNAAIAGAYDGGATEVVVSDGHGASNMRNLLLEELDERAEAVVGSPKPLTQMAGIGAGFGVVFFVGYHARMGSDGILSHTIMSQTVAGISVNGRPVGETGINALIAGGFGVPIGLVTGDQCLAAEARELLPWVDTVVVKHALTRTSARCLAPGRARAMIREAAARSVGSAAAGKYTPLRLHPPLVYEVQFLNSGLADKAARMDGAERINPTTLRVMADDPVTAFQRMRALIALA